MKRVIVGGISHETSTFTPVATTLQSFHERFLLRGNEILEVLRGTNTPIGGYIDGAAKHGFELIPTLFAEAHTSGPAPRPVFDCLVNELLEKIEAAGAVDGVLLELHGSMCAGDLAQSAGRYPAIFADMRDNTGGGSPGDSTGMLQAFIEARLRDACVLNITDPESVKQCHAAGEGATLTLDVGGKSSPLQGEPIRMTARVVGLSNGKFHYDGPMFAGLESDLGPSAHIEQDGIHVLLTTLREQPFCTAFARSLKLDTRQMRYIGVKSSAHFRAGFESWAGSIHVVSEPSVHDLGNLPYKRLNRRIYPFQS